MKNNEIDYGFNKMNIKFKTIEYLFFFLLLFWSAGFLFPVLSPTFAGKPIISQLLSYNYSLVCHQSELSKLDIGSAHILVCARCTGIYLGALFISILMLFNLLKLKLSLKPFFIFTAPLIIDALAVRLGIYTYSKTIAFITGLLCGAIVLFYILETIENSINLLNERKNEFK